MEQRRSARMVVGRMTNLHKKTARGKLLATVVSCLGLTAFSCSRTGQILGLGESNGAGSGGAGVLPGTGGGDSGLGGSDALVPGPAGTELMVSSGDQHTCGVVDGKLYCWGDNQTGALGLGDFDARTIPSRVGNTSEWESVGAGDDFSCGIRAGQVSCWGTGSSGQIGNGSFSLAATPQEVNLPGLAAALGVGFGHACAVLENNRLFCWGSNTEGQLAQDDPFTAPAVDSAVPVEVGSDAAWSRVSPGQGHTCAIQVDGTLWCWGRNSLGELGLGAAAADQIRVPMQVGLDADWTDIAAGQNHTCGVRGAQVLCWGDNSHGQLGSVVVNFTEEPTLVPEVTDAKWVTLDTFHTCAIQADSSLSCWGRNVEGLLGDGTTTLTAIPSPAVPALDWDQVSAGRFHTCGIRQGSILCTGENGDGRLGTGDLDRRQEFTPTLFAE